MHKAAIRRLFHEANEFATNTCIFPKRVSRVTTFYIMPIDNADAEKKKLKGKISSYKKFTKSRNHEGEDIHYECIIKNEKKKSTDVFCFVLFFIS